MMCGNDLVNPIYKKVAKTAYNYLKTLQKENGRMLTSYELGEIEDWRPVSSDTSMAVYAFARGYREYGDAGLLEAMEKAGEYLLGLQHEIGAILNCNDDC